MVAHGRTVVSLPLLTKVGDHTKIQLIVHVRTPTNPYHIFRRPGTNHWWFWFGLPTLTSLRIWVGTYRQVPLPTFTTWRRGLGIDNSCE